MATINEQLIKAYQGMTAEQQAKIYSAWNSQVKRIIDAYKSTQNNTAQPQPVAKPTTQQIAQPQGLNTEQQQRLEQVKSSGAYQEMINKWLTDEQIVNAVSQYKPTNPAETQVQPQAETQPATPPATATQTPPAKYDWLQWDVELKDIEGSTTGVQLYKWFADYQDESQRRLQEIASNVKNFYTTNPEVFSNYDTFKNFFSYNDRVGSQKQVLDSFRQVKTKWDWLATKWINDLLWLYTNWWLSSSDLDWIKSQNPSKYNELMWLINKKTELAKYDEALNETKSENPFQSIINNYTANMLSMAGSSSNMFAEYKAAMNSTEMKDMRNWLAELEWEMRQLDEQMNNIRRNVEERYKWTWASRSKINAVIQDELWKLQEARSALWIEYQTLASKYNNQMSTIKDRFEMQIKEQEYNNSQRNQQMSELGFAMQLMSYETPAQQDERAWNNFIRQQEYADWNIYSTDPKTRQRAVEKAVDRVLAEFQWIPMVRSREQMVSDIQRMVDSGMELWDAITENIRKPIMNKPEYNTWSMNKLWINTNLVKMGDNMLYDPVTQRFINWATEQTQQTTENGVNYTPATLEKFSSSYQNMLSQWEGAIWWQCWSFVNDYLQSMWVWRLFVDPISAKKTVKNSDKPEIWSVAIIDWSNNPNATLAQQKYWHVGIVTAINNDWTVTIKQSNNKWDEKIFTSKFRQDQIYWYFDPTKWTQQVATWQSSIVESWLFDATFETYFEQQKKITSLGTEKDRQAIFASMWINSYTDFQRLANERKAARPVDARTSQLLNKLDNLERSVKTRWPRSLEVGINPDLKADYNFVKKNLALESLQAAKAKWATFGAMSNEEWKILWEAATALSPRLSGKKFQEEIQNIRNQIYENYPSLRTQSTQSTQQSYQFSIQPSYTSNTITLSNGMTFNWD